MKSHFSIGLGTARSQLSCNMRAESVPALASTDLENLSGQVLFHAACRAAGISPVTGVELRARFCSGTQGGFGDRRGRLVLLASGAMGYSNPCQIVTERRTGPMQSRPPLESLRGALTGLFAQR